MRENKEFMDAVSKGSKLPKGPIKRVLGLSSTEEVFVKVSGRGVSFIVTKDGKIKSSFKLGLRATKTMITKLTKLVG